MEDQYEVVKEDDYTKFIDGIHDLMEAGYEPLGGISMAYDANHLVMVYAQAMLKKADKAS